MQKNMHCKSIVADKCPFFLLQFGDLYAQIPDVYVPKGGAQRWGGTRNESTTAIHFFKNPI